MMNLRDIDIRRTPPVNAEISIRRAWQTMQAENVTTLCVTDAEGKLSGIITLKDISTANLDGLDNYVLAKAETGYENVVDTLDGTILAGDSSGKTVQGRIVVGAGSAEQMERAIHTGDIVIVSTPHNVYATAQIIAQAAPVRHYMLSDGLLTFDLNTPVENAAKVMSTVRHRYFPVLDDDGRFFGMVSHRNLLNR